MTLSSHGSIQNSTRQYIEEPVNNADHKIAEKMPSCYVHQSVPKLQRHQIYTCPVAVSKLQAEQGVHAALKVLCRLIVWHCLAGLVVAGSGHYGNGP
jgi:hypothetical protein